MRVALIGAGYWGSKLAKKLHQLGVLVSVFDMNIKATRQASEDFGLRLLHKDDQVNLFGLRGEDDVDGIVIATPPDLHYFLAKCAFTIDKNVLVEKPLCTSVWQARELLVIAENAKLSLRVDHTHLYAPGLRAMLDAIKEYRIDKLSATFLNEAGAPGGTRSLEYAALPHAVSIACAAAPPGSEVSVIEVLGHREAIKAKLLLGNMLVVLNTEDYAGVHVRQVVAETNSGIYTFDGDKPFGFTHEGCVSIVGREDMSIDPLYLVCKSFIDNPGFIDPNLEQIVELTEAIAKRWRKTCK